MKTNAISLCVIFEELFIQVVERANNVQYGLSASVWSTDVGKIHRVAHKLEVVPLQALFILVNLHLFPLVTTIWLQLAVIF